MQLIDGRPVFAATDLVAFLACDHLVGLELAVIAGLAKRPVRNDPEIDLVARRGIEHERRYLAALEAAGRRVTRIEQDEANPDRGARLRQAAAETEAALRRGDDVVYQAVFFDGRWLGLADFVERVEKPSDLGSWSYEVVDTKLARHVKASALLQVCSYVEQLARIQGTLPEEMRIALGGSRREVAHERVADYMAYYRTVKRSFEEAVDRLLAPGPAFPPVGTYPEEVEHCDVCRWNVECRVRRRADDDLSLVANAGSRVRKALKAAAVTTRRGLAALPEPPALESVGAQAMANVYAQARIQVEGEDRHETIHELFPPERLPDGTLQPDRGLLILPPPRPGDLFFDIEGDPFAFDDGVDYLFGILEPGVRDADGNPLFHAIWSIDEAGRVTPEAEKRAFEQTIDLMLDRLARDPDIHIYHYAAYEHTALGRLMGRYATREEEVDRLLRGGVLVDLYRAVRQSLRASVESYSIKKLEPLYGLRRDIDLRDAGSSIVEFEAWLAETETDDPATPLAVASNGAEPPLPRGAASAALARIEGYNRDDCVSNWQLRDWLEERRTELERQIGEPLPRPVRREPEAGPELSERLRRVAALTERLSAGVADDPAARTPAEHARWLLGQLLSWHRREDKSFWWRFYYLLGLTDEERIEEREPIGGLVFDRVVAPSQRSIVYRYRFPIQEHEIEVGTAVCDPATGRSAGSVVAVDDVACTLDLRRGSKTDGPHPTSLVPCDYVDSRGLADALLRVGEWVADNGIEAPGPYAPARSLLLRQPPRTANGGPLRRDGEEPLDAARRLAPLLDGDVLAVQGPPGSGKTYLGASLIVDLVEAGWKVGVTANSHKVIGHLLEATAARAGDRGAAIRIGQKADEASVCTAPGAERFGDYGKLLAAIEDDDVDVVGGTAWLWTRPEFAESIDVLVVDEASQLSLANAVAVSQAARRSLVLLGDPQQLEQPLQGTHPPGAEASALGHLLAGRPVMPDDLGLFLERTRRLHPDLCRFTSETFYAGELSSQPGLERQDLDGPPPLQGTGVRFLVVDHEGNATSSPQEAEVVASLLAATSEGDGTWTRADGKSIRLGLDDVVVVAPYNAQVAEIAERLPAARVGTVDKFQGQEAAVAIYSMASSSPADAPRGMEFLYSLNRLNVATSRARCLALIVASPQLLHVNARTPRQMRLANALCRFVELAAVPDDSPDQPAVMLTATTPSESSPSGRGKIEADRPSPSA